MLWAHLDQIAATDQRYSAFLHVAGNFTDLDGEQSVTAFRAFLRAGFE